MYIEFVADISTSITTLCKKHVICQKNLITFFKSSLHSLAHQEKHLLAMYKNKDNLYKKK